MVSIVKISMLFSGISWVEYQALVTVATAISAFAFITLICVRRSASFGKYVLVAICSPIVGKFALKSLSAAMIQMRLHIQRFKTLICIAE